MKRVLSLLTVFILSAPALAALPPDAAEKYPLTVVFRCGAHNWLGEQFRDDLRNDLTGILQDALGAMAEVRVVDLKKAPTAEVDPLWKDFEAKGFAALDSPRDLTGVKTHFLRVDFVNGQYELQARQHDGLTGFVSPLRHDRTADRALVTRLAGQMIAHDFGVVGTVTGSGDNVDGQGSVTVAFRAGALPAPLDRWVHKKDVFAVYGIVRAGDKKERGKREPDSLVQVTDDPKNGTAPARIVFRKENPLKNASSYLGFRCVRLDTAVGPMRLRLVDERGVPHARALQIRVHPEKFQTGISQQEEILDPDRGGLYVTKRNYENVAFVRIVTGTQMIARVPVEVLGDRPVTVEVGLSPESELRGQLQYRHGELKRMYDEAEYVHLNNARAEINALVRQGKFEAALKRAKENRDTLDEDIKRLRGLKEELKKDIGTQSISLVDCDKPAADLEDRQVKLNQKIGELDETIRRANDPSVLAAQKKLEDSFTKARALYENNEYDAAIAQYRAIIKEFGEQPKVRKDLDDLEKAWAVKNPEQQQARDFIYKDWAKTKTVADIETKLPAVKKQLQVLIREKDDLALLKLRNTLPEVRKILADEIQALLQNPDDKDKVEKIKKLSEEFDKLVQDVDAALQKK